jgi:hypothetical protein
VSLATFASDWLLCLVQGALVLLPGAPHARALAALRAHWMLVAVPVAGVVGFTFVPSIAASLAGGLSLLALVGVPPLAAVGLARAQRRPRPWLALLIPILLAVALTTPASPAGEGAVLALVAFSCVAAAVLAVAVLPRRLVNAGIVAWAAADLSLALAHGLEGASRALTHAAPPLVPEAVHLQLQRVVVGDVSLEYADLFIAAVLGASLAAASRRRGPAALAVAGFSIAFSAFFLVTDVLPATVPVALALGLEELRSRRAISSR